MEKIMGNGTFQAKFIGEAEPGDKNENAFVPGQVYSVTCANHGGSNIKYFVTVPGKGNGARQFNTSEFEKNFEKL